MYLNLQQAVRTAHFITYHYLLTKDNNYITVQYMLQYIVSSWTAATVCDSQAAIIRANTRFLDSPTQRRTGQPSIHAAFYNTLVSGTRKRTSAYCCIEQVQA